MLTPYPWQARQWRQLLTAASQNRLPHALLLTGVQGIGLGYFADCLSASLLCQRTLENGAACGECKSCILFHAGNHPDLVRIEPEEAGKQIKVDAIRELIDYIHLSSQYGGYKLASIKPAEAMNRSAANTLLKTLEEPPAGSLLILISYQPSRLPVTIRSRCQRLNFSAAVDETAQTWLKSQLSDQQTTPQELLQLAQGAPLKALTMASTDILERQYAVLQDLQAVRGRAADPVKIAEKWQGFEPQEVLQWLITLFSGMARLKLPGKTAINGGNSDNSNINNLLQELANGLDLGQLMLCYDVALKNYHTMTGPISINRQLLLEDIILFWQSLFTQSGGEKR